MARSVLCLLVIAWLTLSVSGLHAGAQDTERSGALPPGAIAQLGETRFQNLGRVFSVAFSPDGKVLAAGSWEGTIFLWEVTTRKKLRQWSAHDAWVKAVAFSPDGKSLASAGREPDIRFWDPATGKEIRRFRGHQAGINSIAFSSDGKLLVSSGDDGTLRLWDVPGGRERHRLKVQLLDPCPALSPDGKTLAAPSRLLERNRTIGVWDVTTGKELRELVGQASSFGAIAFSPDGKTLVSGALYEPRIRFWDVATGKALPPVKMREVETTGLVFGPDGRTLVSAGGSETIIVWETATRRERCRFEGIETGPVSLAYSPDGKVLASGSTDTTVLLWDLTGRTGVRPGPTNLSEEELRGLWDDLQGEDAPRGHRAIWKLVADPERSLPLIRMHLQPIPTADPHDIARLIRDLESEKFAVRERAMRELEKLGEVAVPALHRAISEEKPTLEMRRRVEQLLARIAELKPEQLRALRALEVLEHIDQGESRRLLESLARGAPDARLTKEAKAALRRLGRRP